VILQNIMAEILAGSDHNQPAADSAQDQDVQRLKAALQAERVRCKGFEKAARVALALADRVAALEGLTERLAADQRELRAETRRELAPVRTLTQEVEDLGAAVQQLIRDH
jgi:uncharacterized protein YlxW (UPF0749 family)